MDSKKKDVKDKEKKSKSGDKDKKEKKSKSGSKEREKAVKQMQKDYDVWLDEADETANIGTCCRVLKAYSSTYLGLDEKHPKASILAFHRTFYIICANAYMERLIFNPFRQCRVEEDRYSRRTRLFPIWRR